MCLSSWAVTTPGSRVSASNWPRWRCPLATSSCSSRRPAPRRRKFFRARLSNATVCALQCETSLQALVFSIMDTTTCSRLQSIFAPI